MQNVQIEITWRCQKCGTVYMMTNCNHGKCSYCGLEVVITGLDLDQIKILPK